MARPIRSSPSMAVPPAWLERELDRALEDSSSVIVNRGCDLTESGRNQRRGLSEKAVPLRRSKVWMVQDIEGLKPKCQRQRLMQGEGAVQGAVHLHKHRATVGKRLGVSERAGWVLGECRGVYVLCVGRRPALDFLMGIQHTWVGQIWTVVEDICK